MLFQSSTTCSALCSLILFARPILGHVEMSWPYALRSKFNPENTDADIDYSNTSPLEPDGSDFPCKGYQNDRPVRTVATYTAGSTYNITLSGSATHHGGSCQISLSYDNGATFRVIKSMIGDCPLESRYDFEVPSYAPTGQALLAWTWQNNAGNREYYMNCAEVNVISGAQRRRKRSAFNSFDSLPTIWKANVEGLNDCATTEGDDPVYPDAGPDVVYGNGLSSTSPPTGSTCDSALPRGRAYEDLRDRVPTLEDEGVVINSVLPSVDTFSDGYATPEAHAIHQTSPAAESETSEALPATSSEAASPETSHPEITAAPVFAGDFAAKKAVSTGTDGRSTTTVTVDCVSTVTILIPPTMVTSTTRRPSSTTGSGASPSTRPPYATGDVNARYLPCIPGSFLCTSKTSFLTCNYNDGTVNSDETWVYSSRYERRVADGMECLPMLAPYSSSTEDYEQQGNTQSGSYRDDRYIRARPNGDCDINGSLQCTAGGTQFEVCDQGGWVEMGSVAVGTTCSNGKIVASG